MMERSVAQARAERVERVERASADSGVRIITMMKLDDEIAYCMQLVGVGL
jgi:hypothetical protein